MDMPVVIGARKGRGAASNETGRFESEKRAAFDDGWSTGGRNVEELDDEIGPPPLATRLCIDSTRTIIARTYMPVEIFLAAGLIYLAITFVFVQLFRLLERRLGRHLQAAR